MIHHSPAEDLRGHRGRGRCDGSERAGREQPVQAGLLDRAL